MSCSNLFLALHHWSALLCVPTGAVLNLLLLWLILTCTPKEMWLQSRVLLQTCVLDFVQLAVLAAGGYSMLAMQPWGAIVFLDGYMIGVFKKLWPSSEALMNLLAISYGILHFDMQAISVQFLYRYLMLNRNVRIGFGRYVLLLLPSVLITLILSITSLFTMPILTKVHDEMLGHELAEMIQQNQIYYLIFGENVFSMPWAMVAAFFDLIFYAIIIFCGIKMVRFVAAHAMTEHLKELNRQLSRSLVLLAAFPVFIMTISFLGIFSFDFLGLSNDVVLAFKLALSPMLHWLPMLNPIVSIWIFRPYRDAIFSAACCKLKIVPVQN